LFFHPPRIRQGTIKAVKKKKRKEKKNVEM